MMGIKKIIIILCLLLATFCLTLGINKNYVILIFVIPFASLCSLLALNTAVLYIYLKYFVSPQVNHRNKQKSIATEHFKPLRLTSHFSRSLFQKTQQSDNEEIKISLTKDDPAINTVFNLLLKYVLRDFIQSWYVKITNNPDEQSFPASAENIIRTAAINLSNRLQQTDLLQLLVTKLIPRITSHISDFKKAEIALRGKSLERSVTQSDELDLLLASRFRSSSSSSSSSGNKGEIGLHKALTSVAVTTTKPTEIVYLRQLIDRILPFLIDAKDIDSGPVRIIIREIISNLVLQPVMDMLADPDFWCQMIDNYLGKAIIEQEMVQQLREVLDRHSTTHEGIDPEDVMDDIFQNNYSSKKEIDKKSLSTIQKRENDGKKRIKMGPRSQLSSAYLGTGIVVHVEENNDPFDDNDDNDNDKNEEDEDALFKDPTENVSNDYLSMFGSNKFFKLPLYDSTNAYNTQSLKNKRQHSMLNRRSFQDFLQMIQEEKNLLDLKRVRNDIMTQIRKKKAQIVDRDPEEIVDGEKVEDILLYINRLSIAKKRVDKRIKALLGDQFDLKNSTSQLFDVGNSNSNANANNTRKQDTHYYSLEDILMNTSGLSYFMEFLERRGDIIKLQFWLIVEGFNNTEIKTIEEKKTFLKDVKMVYEMYFTDESNVATQHRLLYHVAKPLVTDLRNAIRLAENSLTTKVKNNEMDSVTFGNYIRELHLCLCRIQQQTFWEIEKEHFPYFKRSDLYFKFLSSAPPPTNDDVDTYRVRRSLDETTLYKNDHSNNLSTTAKFSLLNSSSTTSIYRINAHNRPASIHEASLTSPVKVLATPTLSTPYPSAIDYHPVENSRLVSAHLKASLSAYNGKTRRHQRALSDSSAKASSNSRFLTFSNMFTTNRLWNNVPDGQQHSITDYSSSSVPSSIKSLDITTEDDDDVDDDDIIVNDKRELQQTRLVQSNTVEAVEAELRSILDGKNNSNINEKLAESKKPVMDTDEDIKGKQSKSVYKPQSLPSAVIFPPSISSSPPVLKPSLSSSTLLLRGSKGTKSSTAVPVQNIYTLPSWTSSGGIKTISEIEHNTLEFTMPPSTLDNESEESIRSNNFNPNDSNKDKKKLSVKNEVNITNNERKKSISLSNIAEDDDLDSNEESLSSNISNNVHFAPPGDLMLATKIRQLSEEMEKLKGQEAIVDALILKAESQNKVEELRILKKSKTVFRQELQQMQYQKLQYELQEMENVLIPKRSQIKITNATMGTDQHGDFALLYVIEIQQLDINNNFASGWIVARRYSEFFNLHQQLKEKYPRLKMIDFPAKWPSLLNKLQKSFVEARRMSLERYLRALIKDHEICQSQELRSFLSQQSSFISSTDNRAAEWPLVGDKTTTSSSNSSLQSLLLASSSSSPSVQNLQKSIALINNHDPDLLLQKKPSKGFMRHIYKTVAAGIDDILVGPSMLDLITQRLGEQVMEFSHENNNNHQTGFNYGNNSKQIPSTTDSTATTNLPDSLKTEGITRFTEPLCDLFIEMFELKDKTNWLRRQAVVIIIQQILEGTIERKLKETVKHLSSSSMIVFYFNNIIDNLWPDGGPLKFKEPRKLEEKIHTREEANRKLSTWLPDLLGNMVGRQNARKGARRLFTVLQNKRLNQDLIYTLLDEIIYALFPELSPIVSVDESKK
ncbi:PXA domain-containing protein [Cokeromyces recurvatus]|uniref:PXA domain-containing protein n=1 Tax=Cokeromyces recurvatus TaxID=90255 RepID=UPI00221F9256|nr:PXA domain-containing protein [Cokeromyces recurvatus]KAI7908175.1 PXA domain-containing protein [Cokeromyces recurvatus]